MGNQKQKWTQDEEDALLKGVAKHGPGKWKNILKDPLFSASLTHRSNIDLKDKWRNLSVSTASQGSRDKSRATKVKALPAPLANVPNSATAASRAHNVSADIVMEDASNGALDGKNASKYNTMIFEALTTIKDTNGSDISAIFNFIEQRHEVPANFRRLLGSKLRRLVSQGKIEKVQNCYRIRNHVLGTKTPSPKQKDPRFRQTLMPGQTSSAETLEEVAIEAAHNVADAENKSFLASDAVKEAERVSKLAEDADSMLQLVKELYEQCSRGEIVLLA